MKRRIYSLLITIPFALALTDGYAQSSSRIDQSLLIGRNGIVGSARIQAIGGGGASLGGDISAALFNPAGLGFYNRSSVAFTPSYETLNTQASFLGNSSEGAENNFHVNSFGVVFHNRARNADTRDWQGGSFSVSFHRLNTYDASYGYAGTNQFSIIDGFVGAAQGISPTDLNNDLDQNYVDIPQAAFDNNLINPDIENNYYPSLPIEQDNVTASQEGSIEERGQQTQWNIAYGGNFKDKLYIGASIGLRGFSYRRLRVHDEIYNGQDDAPFAPVPGNDEFTIDFVDYVYFEDDFRISGIGINASLGIIYRPITELTLGLSYQTPTVFGLEYQEDFVLQSNVVGVQLADTLIGNEELVNESTLFRYNMSLNTPGRLSFGATYFFEKYGFLTANIDYLNYGNSTFDSDDVSVDNRDIETFLTPAINANVGGEFRYDVFRFRLGYAYQSDPTDYEEETVDDRSLQAFSAGVGIRLPNFFTDLSVINTRYESDFVPYFSESYTPKETNVVRGMLTLGFNF